MEKKKEYVAATLTVVALSECDLIRTSNDEKYVNPGEWT